MSSYETSIPIVVRQRLGGAFRDVQYAATHSRQYLDVWIPRSGVMPAGGWAARAATIATRRYL